MDLIADVAEIAQGDVTAAEARRVAAAGSSKPPHRSVTTTDGRTKRIEALVVLCAVRVCSV